MSIVSEWHPPRPYCLPGCNRLDGHDGRDPGACMREGGVLKPGPLDLVHQHPDIPVNVPVRGILAYDLPVPPRRRPGDTAPCMPPGLGFPSYSEGPYFAPFRKGGITPPRDTRCYPLASGAMVHVKPDCRC